MKKRKKKSFENGKDNKLMIRNGEKKKAKSDMSQKRKIQQFD